MSEALVENLQFLLLLPVRLQALRLVACVDPASLHADRRKYLAARRVHIVPMPCTPEKLLASLDGAVSE